MADSKGLTAAEVARRLGVQPATVHRMRKDGLLPARLTPADRPMPDGMPQQRWAFDEADVQRLLDAGEVPRGRGPNFWKKQAADHAALVAATMVELPLAEPDEPYNPPPPTLGERLTRGLRRRMEDRRLARAYQDDAASAVATAPSPARRAPGPRTRSRRRSSEMTGRDVAAQGIAVAVDVLRLLGSAPQPEPEPEPPVRLVDDPIRFARERQMESRRYLLRPAPVRGVPGHPPGCPCPDCAAWRAAAGGRP